MVWTPDGSSVIFTNSWQDNLPDVKQNISRRQLHFLRYCLLGPWGLRTAGPIPGSPGWTHIRSPACARAHARACVWASPHAPLTWSGNPSSPFPPWSRSAAEGTSWQFIETPAGHSCPERVFSCKARRLARLPPAVLEPSNTPPLFGLLPVPCCPGLPWVPLCWAGELWGETLDRGRSSQGTRLPTPPSGVSPCPPLSWLPVSLVCTLRSHRMVLF